MYQTTSHGHSSDVAMSLLGIYAKEIRPNVQRRVYRHVHCSVVYGICKMEMPYNRELSTCIMSTERKAIKQ